MFGILDLSYFESGSNLDILSILCRIWISTFIHLSDFMCKRIEQPYLHIHGFPGLSKYIGSPYTIHITLGVKLQICPFKERIIASGLYLNFQTRVGVKHIWNSKCYLDITGFPVQKTTFDQICSNSYMDMLGIFSRERSWYLEICEYCQFVTISLYA